MIKITGTMNKSDNPTWPPKIGAIVALQKHAESSIYIGRVESIIMNDNAASVLLLNDQDYIDETIMENEKLRKHFPKSGYIALLPTYAWKYTDSAKLKTILGGIDELVDHGSVLDRYNKLISGEASDIPHTVKDIDEGVHRDPSAEKDPKCGATDDFHDDSLLNQKGELQMENLFKEKQINHALFAANEKFSPTSSYVQELLLNKLKGHEIITDAESILVVNKSVAVKNMIETKADEENEGKKIITWVINNLINVQMNGYDIFRDLKMSIFGGYVHITRKGLNPNDSITQELVPNLKFFKWQYGIPIDYDTLKYILFQNASQQKIDSDLYEQKEAERILSQEYLICMQPEPKYQMWCLKRLLMCFYADNELQYNIRKIKVLINQWRARSDKRFNRTYGILPSIIIYPRYGKASARYVLKKLADFFILYQNTGWKCSTPSYFTKVNDLVWYTNGAIDLKLYYRIIKQDYKNAIASHSFRDHYSSVNGADNLILQEELIGEDIKLR